MELIHTPLHIPTRESIKVSGSLCVGYFKNKLGNVIHCIDIVDTKTFTFGKKKHEIVREEIELDRSEAIEVAVRLLMSVLSSEMSDELLNEGQSIRGFVEDHISKIVGTVGGRVELSTEANKKGNASGTKSR